MGFRSLTANKLVLALRLRSLELARIMIRAGLRSSDIAIADGGQRVAIIPAGVTLHRHEHEFALRGAEFILQLIRSSGAVFRTAAEGGLDVIIAGLDLHVSSWEELNILSEIFVSGVYRFTPHCDVIVADVGMNAGFAALSFASQARVAKVFAFEPFRVTYDYAMRNLDRNTHAKAKIVAKNIGLGYSDEERDVEYVEEYKGSMSVTGLTSTVSASEDSQQRAVQLRIVMRAAAAEIGSILRETPARPLVVKLDCEGSEYAILRSLKEAALLPQIHCFMIEWHERGSRPLVELLSESGFVCFDLGDPRAKIGMIYALRQDC